MGQSDVDASEKLNPSECHPNTCSVKMNTSEEEENNCSSRFKERLELLMSFFTRKIVCSCLDLIIAVVLIVVSAFIVLYTVLTSNCTATSVMSNSTLTNLMSNSTPTKLTSDATPFPSTPVTNQNEEDLDVSAEPHNQDPNTELQIKIFPSKGPISNGQDIFIVCELLHVNRHGYFDFYRDKDMLFDETDGVMMENFRKSWFATLHIEKAKPADSGHYYCLWTHIECPGPDCFSVKSESVNVTVIK